jgi:hypothetical protein
MKINHELGKKIISFSNTILSQSSLQDIQILGKPTLYGPYTVRKQFHQAFAVFHLFEAT